MGISAKKTLPFLGEIGKDLLEKEHPYDKEFLPSEENRVLGMRASICPSFVLYLFISVIPYVIYVFISLGYMSGIAGSHGSSVQPLSRVRLIATP